MNTTKVDNMKAAAAARVERLALLDPFVTVQLNENSWAELICNAALEELCATGRTDVINELDDYLWAIALRSWDAAASVARNTLCEMGCGSEVDPETGELVFPGYPWL